MDVDAIQKLIQRRERGDLTDFEYLTQSRAVISQLPTRTPEEEAEKRAMLAYIESLKERALYWEHREMDALAGEVETWLCEPATR